MSVSARLAALVLTACCAAPGAALGQQSRCADCHFANLRPTYDRHISDWDLSAHGRADVGCERCHGGDATTFEPFVAHRDVLHWTNPASPVHRTNVPKTCGTCHAGPFVAFQKSRHFALLGEGNVNVPTCVTCHGAAGENRPSPKRLEAECAACHGGDRPGGHPEYPALGRRMLEGVRDTKALLREAEGMIRRVDDPQLRARLEEDAQQVEVPLTQATQAGHAFVYDNLEERLETARKRLAALFDELVNPRPPAK